MTTNLRVALRPTLIACLVGLGAPFLARAQTPGPDGPAGTPRRITRVWISAGLGPGAFYRTAGLGYRSSANLSVDRFSVALRKAGVIEGIDGHRDVYETSVLGGYRFGGKYLYVIPAVGLGTASYDDDICTDHIQCTPDVAAQYQEKGPVVAYDIGLHASWLVAGLGVNLAGAAGGPKRNFMALVLSLNFGWFDR